MQTAVAKEKKTKRGTEAGRRPKMMKKKEIMKGMTKREKMIKKREKIPIKSMQTAKAMMYLSYAIFCSL